MAKPVERRAGGPSVIIKHGTVIGKSSEDVDTFNGIPFAQPPTDSLRLKPPQTLTSSFGTIQATGTPTACPQFYIGVNTGNALTDAIGSLLDSPLVQDITKDGEDCLTLNVQRPSNMISKEKLPVLFWIFGGGFEFGSTQSYDATSIVKRSIALGKPIIFVAVNYRVGGFGFLAGKELAAEGSTNLGLMDQRLGLQWVQDNIEAFGGDPGKVTIWGESAGSISVFDHTIINGGNNTYKGKPLFRAAIMDSGSVVPAVEVTSLTAQNIYDTVVKQAGCSTSSNTLDCLRAAPYEKFLAAANSVPGIFSYRSLDLSYLPRPDPGSDFFSKSPELAVKAGAYTRVPIIIGDQENEGTLFTLEETNTTSTTEIVDYLTSYFPLLNGNTSIVEGLVDLYPANPLGLLGELHPNNNRLGTILGDLTFTLTRRVYLDLVSSQVPSWSYLSSYLDGVPVLGTFHSSDVTYAFDELDMPLSVPVESIQTYYISFVNSLDPNMLNRGPLIEWPKYTTSSPQLLQFKASSNGLIPDTFRQAASQYLATFVSQFRV